MDRPNHRRTDTHGPLPTHRRPAGERLDHGRPRAAPGHPGRLKIHRRHQLIIDLATGDVRGVEALARWVRADGVVPPAEFIPVAERSDLVIGNDSCRYRGALADLAGWQRLRPGFELNVNLSGCTSTPPPPSAR